jgi:hypothetical protein
MQGFRSFHSACRTIQGIETLNMIRKGKFAGCQRATFSGRRSYQTCSQPRLPPDDCIWRPLAVFSCEFATLPLTLKAEPSPNPQSPAPVVHNEFSEALLALIRDRIRTSR